MCKEQITDTWAGSATGHYEQKLCNLMCNNSSA